MVLIKGTNDQELLDFVRLTEDQNVTVKFIEFMPFKGNKWSWDQGVSKASILETVTNDLGKVEAQKSPKHSTSKVFRVSGFKGNFGIISTITNPFCAECNRIRLTVDGKMKNCLFAHQETDLLTTLRAGGDLETLILEGIKSKKFSRDGMEKMESGHYERNRSMTAIGG